MCLVRKIFNGLLAASVIVGSMFATRCAEGQTQHLALTLGGPASQNRTAADGTRISLGAGMALQANYARKIIGGDRAQLSAGIHFLANGSRSVRSAGNEVPESVATLYVTPNLELKFKPRAKFQPWVTVGGGYAQYESSKELQDRSANLQNIRIHRGAFVYGGGADIPIRKWLALRGEIRDFYSGSPRLNVPLAGGQHNVVAGGGFVLRFGN